MIDREKMRVDAVEYDDKAAQFIAGIARSVTKVELNGMMFYHCVIEFSDIDADLYWEPQDGWDGPSTTADALAAIAMNAIELRRRLHDELRQAIRTIQVIADIHNADQEQLDAIEKILGENK